MNESSNFDANASYGLLPEVSELLRSPESLGLNPSSIHRGGQRARALIERAREQVTDLLGLKGSEYRVVFTSGASEANSTVLASIPEAQTSPDKDDGSVVVTTALEHPSVLEPVKRLESRGFNCSLVAPTDEGIISPEEVLSNCSASTQWVSVMGANNETGQILPVADVVSKVQERYPSIKIHSDAVQVLGKTETVLDKWGVDALSISGHKIGALPGVGALVIRTGSDLAPLILGGPQESRYRAGTENTLGIASFGLAAEVWSRNGEGYRQAMEDHRRYVKAALLEEFPDIELNMDKGPRLPNTLSVFIPGVSADDLVVALDCEHVLVSSGAACASGKPLPSHVLTALGRTEEEARQTLRISLRAEYKPGELERACDVLRRTIRAVKTHERKRYG